MTRARNHNHLHIQQKEEEEEERKTGDCTSFWGIRVQARVGRREAEVDYWMNLTKRDEGYEGWLVHSVIQSLSYSYWKYGTVSYVWLAQRTVLQCLARCQVEEELMPK